MLQPTNSQVDTAIVDAAGVPESLYTALVAIPAFLKLSDIYNFKELQGLL